MPQRLASPRLTDPVLPLVLVVDDEPVNRTLLRAQLEGLVRVVEAGSAAEAYQVLGRERVDLVLLDVMMPGESGIDAARRIKTAYSGSFLPVLLITALSEQEHRNAGLDAGADDYLTKPVDRKELRLRVSAFLKLRAQDRTIRTQFEALARLGALKDDLVSLLVHDLRNPLTALVSFLDLLGSHLETEEQRSDLAAALFAANRIQETILDLLEVRRLEDGVLIPTCTPTSGRTLADSVATLSAGSAQPRNVQVRVTGSDVTAAIDRALVTRALENLVGNAVKHAPLGSEVEIEVVALDDAIQFSVLDRGPGIPDAQKARVFDKYAMLDGAARDMRRGFGLGLYLVDLVARAHGGSARIEDRAGGGAAFRVALPRATG